ncbi:hypothetical protein [Methyloprofundus sp.]|uniref:hypothetical protein n=1 Tax=Methyloprofundus sp. TaxID=2020875 RepID=UPI003D10F800
MLKNYIVGLLLMLPSVAFSTSGSCSNTQLSDYLMHEDNIIVSFRVIDSQFSGQIDNNFIEIEITKEFYSKKLTDTRIKIETENGFGPALSTFTKNIEWLTVLSKYKDTYIFAGCAPTLTIENAIVQGETGINVLDQMGDSVSVEMLELALNAFQQGISSADSVCKSSNSYCSERATYNIETGVLNLPSVEYTSLFGGKVYAKAKMQKVSNDLKTYQITELE